MIRTVLKPGQKGTKKLIKQYGEQLVCVRYRYDYQLKKRYKTIELIIDEDHWGPPGPHPYEYVPAKTKEIVFRNAPVKNAVVPLKINWDERDLQLKIKAIGGKWDKNRKVWLAPEYLVEQIGLGERVVSG